MKKTGTRQEVFEGLAEKTSGGLKKSDLILNSKGKIVSKKQSERGKLLSAKHGFKKSGDKKSEAKSKQKKLQSAGSEVNAELQELPKKRGRKKKQTLEFDRDIDEAI